MNKKDKGKFTAAFKVIVALEAVKGQNTIAKLAKRYELHPSQIMDWKKTLRERPEELFQTKLEWSLRQKGFGAGDMASLSGMFIPFAKTRAERLAARDPRLSLEERYGTHKAYVAAVQQAADKLVQAGFLLPEDARLEVYNALHSDILK